MPSAPAEERVDVCPACSDTHPLECVVCGARFTPNLLTINGFIVCAPCVAWEGRHSFASDIYAYGWPHISRKDAATLYVRTAVFRPNMLPAALAPRYWDCVTCRLRSGDAASIAVNKAEAYCRWLWKLLRQPSRGQLSTTRG